MTAVQKDRRPLPAVLEGAEVARAQEDRDADRRKIDAEAARALARAEAAKGVHLPAPVVRAPEMGNTARKAKVEAPFTEVEVNIPVSLPVVPFDPSKRTPLDDNKVGVAVVTTSAGSGPLSLIPEGSVVQNHEEGSSVTLPANEDRGAVRVRGDRVLHAVAKAIHFLHGEKEARRAASVARRKAPEPAVLRTAGLARPVDEDAD